MNAEAISPVVVTSHETAGSVIAHEKESFSSEKVLPVVVTTQEVSVACTEVSQPVVVTHQEKAVQVVSVGTQGPRGRQGEIGPSGGSAFRLLSDGPLSALRVVWEDAAGVAHLLDYRDAEHVDLLAGITITAAGSSSMDVTVQRSGSVSVENLALLPGRVWLGADGALTQTPAEDGFEVVVGSVTSASKLYLSFFEPIELE